MIIILRRIKKYLGWRNIESEIVVIFLYWGMDRGRGVLEEEGFG